MKEIGASARARARTRACAHTLVHTHARAHACMHALTRTHTQAAVGDAARSLETAGATVDWAALPEIDFADALEAASVNICK